MVEIPVLRRETDRKHNPALAGAGRNSLVELLLLKETRVLDTSVDHAKEQALDVEMVPLQ